MNLGVPTILTLLLWSIPPASYGAAELQPFRIDAWQVEDGLPQSSVTSMVQTRDGYLWLGTFGGLVRFDGVRFEVFNPNNAPGLPSSRILSLFEDRFRTLWIGTEEGYLVQYAHGKFRVCSPPGWARLSGYIQCFAEAGDGKLWLTSPEKELIRFPENHLVLSSTNSELLKTNVSFVAGNSQAQVWSCAGREIGVWENGNYTAIVEQQRSEQLTPPIITGGRDGVCWVAADGRLRKFTRSGCATDYGRYPWSKGDVVRLLEDHLGNLWVGTYGSGLYCYQTNHVVRHFSREDGLPGSFLRSLCEDREGNVWVGTEGSGLARVKPVVFRSYGRKEGLSGDCVLSVCEGPQGELWIGTGGDGLDCLKNGVVRHYGTAQGMPNDYIWSVFCDRNQAVWAGTWGAGLCKLVGDEFVPYENPGQCSGIVCALYQDVNGDQWIGQQRSKPEIVRLQNGKPVVVQLQSRIGGTDVRAITEDRAGNLWIGTQGDGLYRIRHGQQIHFGHQDGLSNEFIRSLYADADGVLWIGTYGGGLNRLQDGKLTSFTTREGLVNDSLGFIAEDDNTNLWCGSLGGVFRVSKDELNRFASGQSHWIQCLPFTKSEGLPSVECTGGCQPSGCKTRDGRLWFPTIQGLAVVDPRDITVNPLPPPVVIEQVVIEGRKRTSISDVSTSANPDRSPGPLKIAPGSQRLEFHYTGLSLTEPLNVRFKYRLEGLGEDWVEAGARRIANYSYLPPGKYRFCVQACNNDGIWNEQGDTLALIILPLFWQTTWFKLVCASGVGLLLVGLYEIRLASERKFARVRLRIASDLHDEVGSNLGSIALLSEMIPGPREEANEIRRVALQTVGSLRDIVWFLDPAGDNLPEFIVRMQDTARVLLASIPFEFEVEGEADHIRLSLNLRRNLFPMFKEILHNIARHARATQVTIRLKITLNRLELSVHDNGAGFDQAQVRRGNGLKNLRRRAGDLCGELLIQTQPGSGTRFTVVVPLPRLRGSA